MCFIISIILLLLTTILDLTFSLCELLSLIVSLPQCITYLSLSAAATVFPSVTGYSNV